MTETTIQLNPADVWHAMSLFDSVAAVAEELISHTLNRRAELDPRAPGRLVPWSGPAGSYQADQEDRVALELSAAGIDCVAPAASLCLARTAALTALAARELLVPGGLTVAVVGPSGLTEPPLAVISRHVPDITHISLWLTDVASTALVPPALLDQLELSGIRVSVATSLADAVFGANLVIVAGDGVRRDDLDGLRFAQVAWGAVLVNASGHDLPPELVGGIDDVYVDDLALLETNRHRHAVAAHLADTGNGESGHDMRIVADLGLLLLGQERYPRRAGATVLVELLGVSELSVEFAYRVSRAARKAGLGAPIPRGSA